MRRSLIIADQDGKKSKIDADTVIISLGYAMPDKSLYKALEGKIEELFTVGDCERPQRVKEAVHKAAFVARQI